MTTNDIILLVILTIGAIIINWNIIQNDFSAKRGNINESLGSKKVHIKAAKRVKKKVS